MANQTAAAEKLPSLWTKDFIKIGLTNLLNSSCMQVMISVFPLFLNAKGFSASMIGTVASCYTICAMIMRFTSGNLIDRIGRRKIGLMGLTFFTVALVGYLASTLLEDALSYQITLGGSAISLSMGMVVLFRMVQGFGTSTMTVSTSTMATDILPRERYAEGIGYYGLFNSLATAFGPALGIALIGFSPELTFSVLLVVMIFAILMMNSMKYESDPAYIERVKQNEANEGDKFASDTHGIWRFFEKKALPAAAILTTMAICTASLSNFLTIYAKSIDLEGVGLYFTIQACFMIIARLTAGKVSNKIGVYRTIMCGFVIISVGYFLLSSVDNIWTLYLCGAIYGFGAGVAMPTMQVLAMSGVSRQRRGTANSTYLASFDIGAGLGASIWGFTIDAAGSYSIIYFIAAFVMLFGVVLAFILSKKFPSQY